ncbi:hypothetical protein D6D23_10592 [Aureobasidium pullulans]|nr:hypothetical protein D6D23_10592 [Aureobasidium pullulans]
MESWSGTLTCTRPFWNGIRSKLEAMAANTDGKIKIARGNIHDKAQIAAYHCATRFTVFMETPSCPGLALSTTLTVTNYELVVHPIGMALSGLKANLS